ncbi:MAG: hypothetical protein JRJ39_00245 [Deltaproteobacteria bacterium]|nr:hypothetical protein [Deltaproteobacteria bacterium]
MEEQIVKIFNKGKRMIDDINPDDVVEVPLSRAEKLKKLFSAEIIIVAEGQDPHVAANNDSAQCAALKKEVVALNEKIEDLQKSDNSEVVDNLQKEIATLQKEIEDLKKEEEGRDESEELETLKADIEPLKAALSEKEDECGKLVKELDKAKKELAKKKSGNKK